MAHKPDIRLTQSTLPFILACLLLVSPSPACLPAQSTQSGHTVLDQIVSLPRQTSTVYGLLNQISRETGYFFVYDSDLVDNDRRIRIQRITAPVRSLLRDILDDAALEYAVVDQHILIFPMGEPVPETISRQEPSRDQAQTDPFFTIGGRILSADDGRALPNASISIPGRGMGIASNLEGRFALKIPRELVDTVVRFSYMGYKPKEIPLRLLEDRQVDVYLETDYISMQEVIIRYFDPELIIQNALDKRAGNYPGQPVLMTAFYREGVKRNEKLLNYSEAIFEVYKGAYTGAPDPDQVRLIQSRRITNIDQRDTLDLKLEAGVSSTLQLDFVKNLPEFLDPKTITRYQFTNADIVSYNSKNAYAIEFAPAQRYEEAMFSGILFVDMESLAFLGAELELNPRVVNREQHLFIRRRSRGYNANIVRVHYAIRYQEIDGTYHMEHIRGELELRFRRRRQLFSNTYFAFFEKSVGHVQQEQVARFSRSETLRTNTVFSEEPFQYDNEFWGRYNIITPEKEISQAWLEVRSRIESIVAE
jgi:hypothetical protein